MSDHLPIQRYFLNTRYTRDALLPAVNERLTKRRGDWVLYADHLAALRACEERVRESWYEVQSETWVQGYAAGLDAARKAVAALLDQDDSVFTNPTGPDCTCMTHYCKCHHAGKWESLTAIDALREETK